MLIRHTHTRIKQTPPSHREHCLASLGLPDIFLTVKAKENTAALTLLPSVLAELDALASTPRAQWTAIIQGVFAGNVFDLGAAASSAMYASGQVWWCAMMLCWSTTPCAGIAHYSTSAKVSSEKYYLNHDPIQQ